MLLAVTALVLICAVVLGGGTRAGFMGDVIVQAVAVPLLFLAVFASDRHAAVPNVSHASRLGHESSEHAAAGAARWSTKGYAGVLFLIMALLALAQLAPLPSALVRVLAPQGAIEGLVALPGLADAAGWRSVSLTPYATWSGLISLLVPLAIFLAVAQLSEVERLRIVGLLLILGALSALLGLLQVAQGPASDLRLFEVTNPNEAVGFFANRNHFAAQMYVLLVLATAWIAGRMASSGSSSLSALLGSPANLVVYALGFGLLVAIIASLATARSRAGILLTMAAIVGLIALIRSERAEFRGGGGAVGAATFAGRFLPLTLGFAVLFAMQFGLHRLMSRFSVDPLDDLRIPLARITFEAAWKSLPLGAGIGSFVPVYGVVERPAELSSALANRAHNDLAEWFLEAGWLSAALLMFFIVWFTRSAWRVWRRGEGGAQHRLTQRAATLVLVLLFAHSFIDYPLRTTALMAIAALSAALLVPPLVVARPREHVHSHARERTQVDDELTSTAPPSKTASVRPMTPFAPAAGAEAWPEAWRPKRPKSGGDETPG